MSRSRSTFLFAGLIAVALGSILLLVSMVGKKEGEAGNGEFPRDWIAPGTEDEMAAQSKLIGKPMPPLDLTKWHGGEIKPDDLKGKIVVLDFWATWCAPCIAAFPENSKLYAAYRPKGVEMIGICTNSGQETFEKIVDDKRPEYPVARDANQNTMRAWCAQSYPTYAVVDRQGIVRTIGLKHEYIEKVVQRLLAEPTP